MRGHTALRQPDDLGNLEHIAEMLRRLEGVAADGRQAFDDDLDRQDATLRRLQTLSESAQRLSAELKERHSSVPRSQIAGMRNRLVHV